MLISTQPAEPTTTPLLARRRVLDALIMLAYLLASFGLYRDLWLELPNGYLVDSGQDQNLFEWFFAVQAHAVASGSPTLFTTLQNHPVGVNLMANTAMPGLAVPLAPLTLLAGPTVTWTVVLTAGLAGTAAGWYWLFSRWLVRSRWSAAIGGACCAFAPPVISHAHAHPNFTAMFLLPVIVIWVLRLCSASRRTSRVLVDGVILGLLVAWQVMIGEEPLFILATGLVVFGGAYAVVRPAAAKAMMRPLFSGLGVAAGVALLLVGYPLWHQFTGPGSYRALQHHESGNDLAAFTALPKQSVGGQLLNPDQVVPNPTEQNAFFGWPLVILLVVTAIWLWREIPARLAAITILVMGALSVGERIKVDGTDTGLPGPWLLLHQLPLFDSVLEGRLTLACLPAMGMLLALATDRVLVHPAREISWPVRTGWLTSRRLWFAALAVAVLPVLPVRFITEPRQPTPELFAEGGWRDYIGPGRAVATVPLPNTGNAEALHWQVQSGLRFALAEGYFVGPFGPNRNGGYGPEPRPTSVLLAETARTGVVPVVTETQQRDAVADLRFWRVDAVVLTAVPNGEALRATLDQLLGPGEQRGDAIVWDVRDLTAE